MSLAWLRPPPDLEGTTYWLDLDVSWDLTVTTTDFFTLYSYRAFLCCDNESEVKSRLLDALIRSSLISSSVFGLRSVPGLSVIKRVYDGTNSWLFQRKEA